MSRYFSSNKTGLRETYEERKRIENDLSLLHTGQKRTWGKEFYYGRINEVGEVVVPLPDSVKLIPELNREVYALNFVVDAFHDLMKAARANLSTGKIKDSTFNEIRPVRGHTDPEVLYDSYMRILFQGFTNYATETRETNKRIKNFKTFIILFSEFIQNNTNTDTISYSQFVVSKYADPRISGMIIDISDRDPSDDFIKDEKYWSSPYFKYYIDLCKRYGFAVDKNIPWRLIADINSPAMQEYINKYVDGEVINVFSTLYEKTYQKDLDLFKKYMFIYYNSFVEQNLLKCRKKITKVQIDQLYSESDWVSWYAQIAYQ